MTTVGSFYALRPRWTRWDQFYRVYILPDAIAGACLAGQVYDEESGRVQLATAAGIFAPLMMKLVSRIVRKRNEREARYADLEPGTAEFLEVDDRNFIIRKDEVNRTVIHR